MVGGGSDGCGGAGAGSRDRRGDSGSIASGGEGGRNPLVMVLLEEVWSRVQDWEARLGQGEGLGDTAGLAYMHVGQLVTQARATEEQLEHVIEQLNGTNGRLEEQSEQASALQSQVNTRVVRYFRLPIAPI